MISFLQEEKIIWGKITFFNIVDMRYIEEQREETAKIPSGKSFQVFRQTPLKRLIVMTLRISERITQ